MKKKKEKKKRTNVLAHIMLLTRSMLSESFMQRNAVHSALSLRERIRERRERTRFRSPIYSAILQSRSPIAPQEGLVREDTIKR